MGSVRVVVAKVLNCGLKVSEFELQSRYYVHFWSYTLGKSMNPLIPQVVGQIVSLLFYKDGVGIK